MYGVTRAAVSTAIRDRKLNIPVRPSFKEFIPWTILETNKEDRDHHVVRMLRAYGKTQMGRHVTVKERAQLEGFLRMLEEEGCVIAYDPDNRSQPFSLVPAGPDDYGYVRRHPQPCSA